MRIIQNKIVTFKGANPNENWEIGLSSERLQEALNSWTVSLFFDNPYRFDNIDELDLTLVLDSFNINIYPDLYSKADLKSIKTNIAIL